MLIRTNVSLAAHTSLGVGGPARIWYETGMFGVPEMVRRALDSGLPICVLGEGTNVLASDTGWDGVVIRIITPPSEAIRADIDYRHLTTHQEVRIGAGAHWDSVVAYCVAGNLQGIECLSGIPGTVGAAPVQNIGAYGQQIADVIERVDMVDLTNGTTQTFDRERCTFQYRASIFNRPENRDRYLITRVTLRVRRGGTPCVAHRSVLESVGKSARLSDVRAAVLHIRKRKGMLAGQLQSAGSFFKNPALSTAQADAVAAQIHVADNAHAWRWPQGDNCKVSAAFLIEQAGFSRGYRQKSAGISPMHTLALINRNGGTANDITALACKIQERVRTRFGVILEPEVLLLGFAKYPLMRA